MHYRAYTKVKVSNRKNEKQHTVEEVAFEGAGETADFDAGDTTISKVVFYTGKGDEQTVAGSVDVGKSGKISVGLPE